MKTVDNVQAALMDLVRDIHSGDISAKEARPIEKEINALMKKVRAQIKSLRGHSPKLASLERFSVGFDTPQLAAG